MNNDTLLSCKIYLSGVTRERSSIPGVIDKNGLNHKMKYMLKHVKDIHTRQNSKLNSETVMKKSQRKYMFARI